MARAPVVIQRPAIANVRPCNFAVRRANVFLFTGMARARDKEKIVKFVIRMFVFLIFMVEA